MKVEDIMKIFIGQIIGLKVHFEHDSLSQFR